FGQIVSGALAHRLHRTLDGSKRGHDDDDALGVTVANLLHQLEARKARHLQVGDDEVGGKIFEFGERLKGVGGGLDGVAFIAQELGKRGASVGFVVDNEDTCAVHSTPTLRQALERIQYMKSVTVMMPRSSRPRRTSRAPKRRRSSVAAASVAERSGAMVD